jgi:wyosine [tRNA(Phe)-imidazoG37] synthetase (radical SAM superfamily)
MEQNTPKKITLKGTEYVVKQSFRALIKFEEMTKKSVNEMSTSIADLITLLYCVLAANNRETFKFTYDEFVDIIDESPDTINQFSKYLEESSDSTTEQDKKKA